MRSPPSYTLRLPRPGSHDLKSAGQTRHSGIPSLKPSRRAANRQKISHLPPSPWERGAGFVRPGEGAFPHPVAARLMLPACRALCAATGFQWLVHCDCRLSTELAAIQCAFMNGTKQHVYQCAAWPPRFLRRALGGSRISRRGDLQEPAVRRLVGRDRRARGRKGSSCDPESRP
ncbi:hypothetical protein FKP32DRAFT_1596596 [Trametes sanguinea]|nr:hypothetical protein FKP32DRAFT_1596596 [Trametes sanguinea]